MDATITKPTRILCDKLPLVPVTLTLYAPAAVPSTLVKLRIALPVSACSATMLGLMLQVGHRGQAGGGEVVRVTLPLNPNRLVSTIADVALDPATTV
jgi:hypothetical protein